MGCFKSEVEIPEFIQGDSKRWQSRNFRIWMRCYCSLVNISYHYIGQLKEKKPKIGEHSAAPRRTPILT